MDKRIINTPNAPAPIGPYSQAVASNGTLYISGQIPIDPSSGELISSGIQDETHQVMKNLKAILEEASVSFNHVVKTSIFVADMGDFAAINEVYGSYFGENPPARETVEVSTLPKNVNVEISCIATLR
ncbi:MAG: RidA family protein [Cyclobacteriaceae bacterium]|nr:RidA family protein [Cyclobacteriaceae bacterium]